MAAYASEETSERQEEGNGRLLIALCLHQSIQALACFDHTIGLVAQQDNRIHTGLDLCEVAIERMNEG